MKDKKVRNGIRHVIWNTKKAGGWTEYYKRTNDNTAFNKLAEMEIKDTTNAIQSISKELTNVKFLSFGKVSVSKKKKTRSKLDKIFENKHKEEEVIEEELNNAQRGIIESEQENLISLKKEKGRAAAIFKLKERIVGPKKNPLEPLMLIDPETGFEVMEPEEIKRVSLHYCVELLTNREPKDKYVELFNQKERLH